MIEGDDETQQLALLRARRNATGLLAGVALLWVLSHLLLDDGTATGFVRAALEAGLVGGLADWFAVVALFRHPLGIPIPHTAVIPQSKDGLGRNLATFVEGNFLSEEQVLERVADPEHVDRLARWLEQPANADRVVQRAAVVVDATLDAVDEDALVDRATAAVRTRLEDVPVATLAGQGLEAAIHDGRHDPVVTAALEGIVDTMVRNRQVLRRRLGEQSPSWVPPVVDDLVFDQAEHVIRTFLQRMAADPEHELRRALDDQLLEITTRLQTEQDVQRRVGEGVQDVLTDELLRGWIRRWWGDVGDLLERGTAEDAAGTAVRAELADAVADLGRRLRTDTQLHERANRLLAAVAKPVSEIGQREVGGMIQSTVDRWDAEDTSARLELWLGRDLQFVRINGTVVGALVGLVLHTVTSVL